MPLGDFQAGALDQDLPAEQLHQFSQFRADTANERQIDSRDDLLTIRKCITSLRNDRLPPIALWLKRETDDNIAFFEYQIARLLEGRFANIRATRKPVCERFKSDVFVIRALGIAIRYSQNTTILQRRGSAASLRNSASSWGMGQAILHNVSKSELDGGSNGTRGDHRCLFCACSFAYRGTSLAQCDSDKFSKSISKHRCNNPCTEVCSSAITLF